MGKKSKLKQIRRIANQMPVINTHVVIGERLTGKEAMMEGINEIEGKPVNQDSVIIKKKVVEHPINHHRRMKKLYNQYGGAGIVSYMKAVKHYEDTHEQKEAI